MGVGLFLTGSYASEQSADDWLEQVAAWIEGREEEPLMVCQQGTNSADEPTLFVHIHPCAEDVEVSVPEAGVCVVAAKTSTAGPGYHIFLCELMHSLAAHLEIEWVAPDEDVEGDETGYFFQSDASAVRQEMMRWLSAVSHVVVENCKDLSDMGVRMVSMPLDRTYPDQTGILTPVGPRSPAWFEQMAESPDQGLDFFPWWPEGVGAAFFLGRALCLMWQEVHWRTPVTDEEGELLMDVHLDLERAFHLDPDGAIPWREWHAIVEYLNDYFGYAEFHHEETQEEEISRRAARVDPNLPLVGYRRGRVNVTLSGGWSLTIPGDFADEWEEGGETWSAWLGGRTIWFTSWSVAGDDDATVSARDILDGRPWPDDTEIIEHADGPLLGRAVFMPYEENGETLWNLKGYTAMDGNFCLCNVYLQDQNDLEWALEIWKSVRH